MNTYKFSEMVIGLKGSFHVTLTMEMMNSFREITGDLNPLHTDESYARSRGFEGRVVYGMLTASFYSTLVGVHLPGERALFHSLETSFNSPVAIGQQLIISGEIVRRNEAFRQIEIQATISSPEGKIFSKAKIKAGVHE